MSGELGQLHFEFRQVCVALLRFIHGLPVSLYSVPLKHLSQIRGPLQDYGRIWGFSNDVKDFHQKEEF
jgi:hypothetical protein